MSTPWAWFWSLVAVAALAAAAVDAGSGAMPSAVVAFGAALLCGMYAATMVRPRRRPN